MDASTFNQYINRVNSALSELPQASVDEALRLLSETVDSDNRIWVAGNGGSAATASHFATDLSRCNNASGEPVKGISLCDNSGLITAIGNDFNFEKIFSRQIEAIGNSGDIAVGITTSGNSANIVNALRAANKKKITTFCFVGNKKSKAAKKSNYSILTTGNSVSAIQILQIFLGQIYCEFLENYFK